MEHHLAKVGVAGSIPVSRLFYFYIYFKDGLRSSFFVILINNLAFVCYNCGAKFISIKDKTHGRKNKYL